MSIENKEKPDVLAKKIKKSANQIWLAGLGAFTKAEKEGGRWFENLVKDGELARSIVDKPITHARETVNVVKEKVTGVREKAFDSWDRIESAFDERVASALRRLNIPTHQDVVELTEQVTELKARVKKLESDAKNA